MKPIKFRFWSRTGKVMEDVEIKNIPNINRIFEVISQEWEAMQFTGIIDRKGKEVYEGDIVRVYDAERGCVCSEWEDCDAPSDMDCEEHGKHEHEKPEDCDNYLCTQEVKSSEYTGYFCEEDNGEYCPSLGADEIEVEVIGNIYENPELLK